MRPPDQPQTLQQWLWYVRRYENGIYVRKQEADGRWGNVKLADLPPDEWAQHVAEWLERGTIPCRVREREEVDA